MLYNCGIALHSSHLLRPNVSLPPKILHSNRLAIRTLRDNKGNLLTQPKLFSNIAKGFFHPSKSLLHLLLRAFTQNPLTFVQGEKAVADVLRFGVVPCSSGAGYALHAVFQFAFNAQSGTHGAHARQLPRGHCTSQSVVWRGTVRLFQRTIFYPLGVF